MNNPPNSLLGRLKYIGPSVIVTGSVVGSGSIVMTPLLGAAAGFTLLWWLLLSMWSKPIIQAEISRYIVVTRKTFLEAFADICLYQGMAHSNQWPEGRVGGPRLCSTR